MPVLVQNDLDTSCDSFILFHSHFRAFISWFMNSLSVTSAYIMDLFACGARQRQCLSYRNQLKQVDLIEIDRNTIYITEQIQQICKLHNFYHVRCQRKRFSQLIGKRKDTIFIIAWRSVEYFTWHTQNQSIIPSVYFLFFSKCFAQDFFPPQINQILVFCIESNSSIKESSEILK